ncbi:MAG TPA: tetratricopeptide repeat protein [Actinophytocola sp.]|uniref:tetratricopeptide repeat protein n=1 Tax=Actinophytocola sp. TaxID=1872138 RepID=UPI002DB75D78|nr:tetratricopeptide repeat protein [Actinophytocola sp.]HEU5475826.1 tetratricopeptide repeat protein [Actinophytocola sp.]
MTKKTRLRPRGQRVTTLGLLVLLIPAVGVAAALKWPNAGEWALATATALTALAAGAGSIWIRWQDQRLDAKSTIRRSFLGTDARIGDKLPVVADIDLQALRVHAAVVDVPYIPRRSKEREVADHLRAQRPVLIVGSSMVGKTRLAVEVVKDLFPERPVLIPDSPTSLAELDKADMVLRDHVIWLDDLDRFLAGNALTPGLITRLAAQNCIVATIRAREWDRFRPTDQLRPPEWDLLIAFCKVTLDRDRDRPADDDILRAIPDPQVRERIINIGIGEYVGATQHVADQITLGAHYNPLGYALLLGAVDWRRAGIIRGVPAELLPALAGARLTARQRADLGNSDNYADALRWATREINPTVALLELDESDNYSVYDYALDQLMVSDPTVPLDTWELVIDHATADELNAVGYQAEVTYRLHQVAERSWRRAAEIGNAGAMSNLGVLLARRGDDVEAESWYRRAADAGDADAMYNLGVLLARRGDAVEAESLWRRAADAGDADAMSNLGVLLARRGDDVEAESWYRRAADAGDADAMYNLGVLLARRGDDEDAKTWYRRAADAGHAAAMYNLGVLLARRGDKEEAEAWYRRAAGTGHAAAVNQLSVLLAERSEMDEASR